MLRTLGGCAPSVFAFVFYFWMVALLFIAVISICQKRKMVERERGGTGDVLDNNDNIYFLRCYWR